MKSRLPRPLQRLLQWTVFRSPRHEYKRVWDSLARSTNWAKTHVAGYIDEAEFAKSAAESCSYLQEHLGVGPRDVILEIGCGIGRVGTALAPLCAKWIGCDVSGKMLGLARQRLAGCPNVDLVEISGYDLAPLADASVDAVYCIVVFMHLDEWERYSYVAEAARVLRPGGRLLINNLNLCSDEGWAVFEQHRRMPPHERPSNISKTSTPDEFRTYLTRAGFQDIRIITNHMWVTGTGRK